MKICVVSTSKKEDNALRKIRSFARCVWAVFGLLLSAVGMVAAIAFAVLCCMVDGIGADTFLKGISVCIITIGFSAALKAAIMDDNG